MSIYKINTKNTLTKKIELLNDMILIVDGKVSGSSFNKNEIDQIFTDGALHRKYIRQASLGHTLGTYSGWSHVQTESGYSIWKYTPTTYVYNSLNNLYFDNIKLDNRAEAITESASSFDFVFLYNGDSGAGYTDNTTEAGTESGTEFDNLDSINDYLYIGNAATFAGIKFEFHTRGSNYTLKVEYYNGASWTTMTSNINSLIDNTSNFESDGNIVFTIPDDWATIAINSETKYWIRLSTTTAPITVAKMYLIIPANSVIGILGMSSTQILQEKWAWCTYNSIVYVTIKNSGNTSYEGNAFIKSGSTSTNLQNFFVYNHEYLLDHEDSGYIGATTITSNTTLTGDEGVILIDASSNTVIVTLPSATTKTGFRLILKVLTIGGGFVAYVEPESGNTIDDASSYSFSSNYEAITLLSNGTEWYIIEGYKE